MQQRARVETLEITPLLTSTMCFFRAAHGELHARALIDENGTTGPLTWLLPKQT